MTSNLQIQGHCTIFEIEIAKRMMINYINKLVKHFLIKGSLKLINLESGIPLRSRGISDISYEFLFYIVNVNEPYITKYSLLQKIKLK